jgi:hypothetical protein
MEMDEKSNNTSENSDEMKYRKIILADGRYMIFYTFGESAEDFSEVDATEEKDV